MTRRLIPLVALADLFSAYIHFTLVPEHLVEVPVLGVMFAAAGVMLVMFAAVLLSHRESDRLLQLNGALLIALSASYALSRMIGLPVIGEGVEPIDTIGILTQFVQAAGLFCIVTAQRSTAPAATFIDVSALRKDSL